MALVIAHGIRDSSQIKVTEPAEIVDGHASSKAPHDCHLEDVLVPPSLRLDPPGEPPLPVLLSREACVANQAGRRGERSTETRIGH